MSTVDRRDFLKFVSAGTALTTSGTVAFAAIPGAGKTLTIAYNVPLPSWDATSGLSSVNPTIQSIYKSVFDQYIDQNPDLTLKPDIITGWALNADKTILTLKVRPGVMWHDGTPLTPEDVVWSLKRAGDPKTGNPVSSVWDKLVDFKIDGQTITVHLSQYEADIVPWMAFLTAYVLPQKYYEKVGAEGFEAKPIGSGPYAVEEFVRNSYVKLKAFPQYWGAKPAFETVIFKFVPDATSRVAEVESGSSDIAVEVPYDEFDRLKAKPGLAGEALPISDIGMLFITNEPPMLDKNVRLALSHAIDKNLICSKLLRGYAKPIDTLLVPEYIGYDPTIKVPYDPVKAKALLAASGFTPEKPVKFTIQTTRGFKPKDYEVIQAIVGMWRKVGADATIEVYEIAKHFELRFAHKLAPAAFYNWGNSQADPNSAIGFAMFSKSPHSAWKTDDLDAKIGPLLGEKDEAKRIAGYKDVSRYIAEQGYVIPLFQYYQTVLYRKGLSVPQHGAGYLLPQNVKTV